MRAEMLEKCSELDPKPAFALLCSIAGAYDALLNRGRGPLLTVRFFAELY